MKRYFEISIPILIVGLASDALIPWKYWGYFWPLVFIPLALATVTTGRKP